MDAVKIKESNNSEAGCLINPCCVFNNSPSSISNLFLYWAGNNIMDIVYLIQLGINLQYIPTPFHIQSNCTIATYEKKQNLGQVCNQKICKL